MGATDWGFGNSHFPMRGIKVRILLMKGFFIGRLSSKWGLILIFKEGICLQRLSFITGKHIILLMLIGHMCVLPRVETENGLCVIVRLSHGRSGVAGLIEMGTSVSIWVHALGVEELYLLHAMILHGLIHLWSVHVWLLCRHLLNSHIFTLPLNGNIFGRSLDVLWHR